MSGDIFISEKNLLATSTQAFAAIIFPLRRNLDHEQENLFKDVFEPLDEGGLCHIDLCDVPPFKLQVFYCAMLKTKSQNPPEWEGVESQAEKILRMIEQDPRFKKFSDPLCT